MILFILKQITLKCYTGHLLSRFIFKTDEYSKFSINCLDIPPTFIAKMPTKRTRRKLQKPPDAQVTNLPSLQAKHRKNRTLIQKLTHWRTTSLAADFPSGEDPNPLSSTQLG